ncbi:hypothetical protein ACTXT7_001746 [Hymenolepis weldensis]
MNVIRFYGIKSMESELWNLLSELVTRTLGQAVNSQLEKIRSIIPESNLQLHTIVAQVDSLLLHLEDRHRYQILMRILSSISVGIEHIWHLSSSCLRVCYDGEDSSECIATACRVALQESWYTDTDSSGFTVGSDLLMSSSSTRPVIYLSPATPTHLRRWLSLNTTFLCCSSLLITVLPSDENSLLPAISVLQFEKIIQNDIRLGRRPLLLVAYAGHRHVIDHHPQCLEYIYTYWPDYLCLGLPTSIPFDQFRFCRNITSPTSSINGRQSPFSNQKVGGGEMLTKSSKALVNVHPRPQEQHAGPFGTYPKSSTLNGSFDYLPKLARICQRYKIWLHVEGLSFLRLALLPFPPVKPSWVTSINSINLELSLCLGLPRSLNVLLMQSSMPESILLYLNVFPVTAATTTEDSGRDTSSFISIPRSLPSNGLKDALFAWFALRTHDGSHVNRLGHADHLTTYTLQKMKSLRSIEILPNHEDSPMEPTADEIESNEDFVKLLHENSLHCPIILFRYILPAAKEANLPPPRKSLSVINPNASGDAKAKKRFMSESSVNSSAENPCQVVDFRYLNSLNHWYGYTGTSCV